MVLFGNLSLNVFFCNAQGSKNSVIILQAAFDRCVISLLKNATKCDIRPYQLYLRFSIDERDKS